MKVLIWLTDVEPAVRLNAQLERTGVETAVVSPLDDVRGAIRREKPDVIVMTGALVDPQNIALVRETLWEGTAVVGLADVRDPEIDEQLRAIGFVEVYPKPIVVEEVAVPDPVLGMIKLLDTLTDERGCPSDSDSDGVFDGLDRCPATPAGARVNAAGCPEDADADNVPDGVDQCDNTPAGAGVDARGCPQDADEDGVSDGLDRCPDTPKGASVDQLGCPGDEDGDRVLDGLDRCPRTPAGAAVNAFGCPPGVPEGTSGTSFSPGSRRILPIPFTRQSARLPDAAGPTLDSLAAALVAQPNVTVEIAAHGDGTAGETRHLTQLRADAVRRYLISKGVSLQRVSARGYGSDQRLTGGTDAAAQSRNRRIELRVLSAAPGR